jgi:transcriptional regulator with XRE-family HTH domain
MKGNHKMTFGEKLNSMRKNSGFTQEEVAVRLGISPQAVSKWENDLSCPDIMLLPEIAKLYGKSVDELLGTDDFNEADAKESVIDNKISKQNAEIKDSFLRKNIGDGKMFLKVNVITQNGDNINVRLPVTLLKSVKGLLGSIKINNSAADGIDLSEIDFDMIFELIDSGVMGEIVNIVTQNGDNIKVYAEREDI